MSKKALRIIRHTWYFRGIEGFPVKASSYMIDYAFDMADYLHLHSFCVLPRACFARTWRTLI
ncbi:MAG: hypothetical protein ABSC60_15025, partial [Acidobacteriota bacterium]